MTMYHNQEPSFRPSDQEAANTYAVDTKYMNSELARILSQDRMLNAHLPLLPSNLELREDARVLDVACGPGGWVCEVAFHHPQMQVIGVDINAELIEYARATAQVQGLDNAAFQVMNVVAGFADQAPSAPESPGSHSLDFPDAHFDFVNGRFLVSFLKAEWWPRLVREMVRVTRPGGIIRLTEGNGFDMILTGSPAMQRYKQILNQTFERDQRMTVLTPYLGPWLQGAGCTDVHTEAYLIDFHPGSQEYEAIYRNIEVAYYELIELVLKVDPTFTREELEEAYRQCLIAMGQPDFYGQWFCASAWGRAPS
jgi:SAM-dependent methyltransferase